MKTKPKKGTLKAVTNGANGAFADTGELKALLCAIRTYRGSPIIRAALQLETLLLPQPGQLPGMQWAEIDLDAALWTIPAERIKRNRTATARLVSLPTQAVGILRRLHLNTGYGAFAFPREIIRYNRPISDSDLSFALRTMGYGYQRVSEIPGVEAFAIEIQSRALFNENESTEFDPKQDAVMHQAWADYLDKLHGVLPVSGGRKRPHTIIQGGGV